MRPTLSPRTAICLLFRNPTVRPASRLVIFLASFCASPKPDGSWILSSLACEMEFRISQAEAREVPFPLLHRAAFGLDTVRLRPGAQHPFINGAGLCGRLFQASGFMIFRPKFSAGSKCRTLLVAMT